MVAVFIVTGLVCLCVFISFAVNTNGPTKWREPPDEEKL